MQATVVLHYRQLMKRVQCRCMDSSGSKLTISYIHQIQPKLLPKTWRFDPNKVRCQIESNRDKKTRKQRDSLQQPMVVIRCVKSFWSRCKNNEKAQRTCGNKTIQNFKECTGTSKRQIGEGRLNRMCVQSSLCKLWQDLHRRNWEEGWSQITGTQDWSGIQNRTYIH